MEKNPDKCQGAIDCPNPATKFCKNDLAALCEHHCTELHSKTDTNVAEHEIVKFKDRPMLFGKCDKPNHGNKDYEYFCHCCNKPSCSECLLDKTLKSHNHINIQKYYE
jgi:hypothetical protein